MTTKTADLCDTHSQALQHIALPLKDYGGVTAFYGEIATVQCFEDNSFVKKTLQEAGCDRVLLVDGGGSKRCALLGDLLAQLAIDNHWRGVVINGCIRDSDIIATLNIGVKALATNPLKSEKKDRGTCNIEVNFGSVSCKPGDWLYADSDGVVVSPKALHDL